MSLDEKTQKLGELLAQIRNSFQSCAEAIDSFLNYLGAAMEPAFVKEEAFTILKFEAQKGERLGEFEVAAKTNNLPDKWSHAYGVLRQNNATIKSRYRGKDYAYSYWIYGEDRIFRQKLKQQGSST